MKAVIETGGFQYTVQENEKLKIPRREEKEGEKIKFDKILAIIDGDNSEFGKPYLKGYSVEGEILSHGRHKKVTVFKFKKRKGYKRKKGHRQPYTEILVNKIVSKKSKKTKKTK
jgi:large subunit ribosomal protein L21